jgi:hypothetical protein
MSTRLPLEVLQYLEEFAQPFGGALGTIQLLPDQDLEYLVTFPGQTYIVKPWSTALDLQELGYVLGTPVIVTDDSFRELYTTFFDDGLFGVSEKEQALLFNAQHGSFIHLKFETLREPVVILLWVCNQLTFDQKKKVIGQWELEQSKAHSKVFSNELFVSTKYLLPTDAIRITHVPATWTNYLTPADISSHPKRLISLHPATENVIPLYLSSNGWYLFERISDTYIQLLKLENLTGVGLSKIKATSSGSYYVSLGSTTTSLASSSLLSLPSNTTYLDGLEVSLRLEADLRLVDSELIIGTSDFLLSPVIQREFVPFLVEGGAYTQASVGVSFDSLGVGTGQVSNPDLAVSEILVIEGDTHIEVENIRYAFLDVRLDGSSESFSDIAGSSELISTGDSETEADIQLVIELTTVQEYSYTVDPIEYLIMFGARPFFEDPIHQLFISSEYYPQMNISTEKVLAPNSGNSYSAINNS